MSRSLIVAVAENGVIGADNQLPWRLPDDLKRFKALTMGHHAGHGAQDLRLHRPPAAGAHDHRHHPRSRLVATRASPSSTASTRRWRCAEGEVFIAGGGEIYAQAMARADRLYLTHVEEPFDGDAHFPALGGAGAPSSASPTTSRCVSSS